MSQTQGDWETIAPSPAKKYTGKLKRGRVPKVTLPSQKIPTPALNRHIPNVPKSCKTKTNKKVTFKEPLISIREIDSNKQLDTDEIDEIQLKLAEVNPPRSLNPWANSPNPEDSDNKGDIHPRFMILVKIKHMFTKG